MTDDLHELAAAYALDALEPAERDAFEAHHATCESCRREVSEFRATAAELSTGASTPPPASLRDRVLAEVSVSRQDAPLPADDVIDLDLIRRGRRPLLVAVAAALVLIVGIGIASLLTSDDAPQTAYPAVLEAVDARELALEGPWPGSVSVAWSEVTERYAMIAEGLPGPGEGLTYELWIIAEGAPIPAGLFVPDGGATELDDALPATPAVWAITIEPVGGSTQPTGDIILSAEVTGT
ncbi:MAG: anti-sigma factor domain-containing protein [Acidimicrobiales bacterium]